jgi:flagellar hook protein FlgE
MSLFGAMNTAISGLTAQSGAFGNISDNIANSQTDGFKRIDTNFQDYLTASTATENAPGSVVARPAYANDVEGTITQTDSPLNMAVSGSGFFAVSKSNGTNGNVATFQSQQYYTRDGDFSTNSQGYLVNGAGEYLDGWLTDPATGLIDRTTVAPMQVTQSAFNPLPTSNVQLSANLPATPAAGTATATAPVSSEITVYDALGTAHNLMFNWSQNASNDWTVSVNAPDATTPAIGTADIQFGPTTSGNPVGDGTVGQIGSTTGTITSTGYAAGQPATMSMTVDFGMGPQTINVGLGNYGGSSGLTQFAGTAYNLQSINQDGVPPGSYSGVDIQKDGSVVVSYNNGQTRTIGQVPLATFNDPNALQRQDGQAFTATAASGAAIVNQADSNGAGNLVLGSVEGSNVDIASQFSALIVAQQAYTANTKVITTADTMLQSTINMQQ